ncbi:class E sortase [Saccharothrix australiensis]|uniref:class E sortase n=1 Tax=Saccharothrix australiensis TaxID=2072 RepID=UPI0024825671|nr:class E sortase [Saccharothrix australiensis]
MPRRGDVPVYDERVPRHGGEPAFDERPPRYAGGPAHGEPPGHGQPAPRRGDPSAPRPYAPPDRAPGGRVPGPGTGPGGFRRPPVDGPDPAARGGDLSSLGRRLNGEPDPGFRGDAGRLDAGRPDAGRPDLGRGEPARAEGEPPARRHRGGPPPAAEATRYTNAFSGSLPPPPAAPPRPARPRPVDPPTEVIEPVEDVYEDEYDDYDEYYDEAEEETRNRADDRAGGAHDRDDHGDEDRGRDDRDDPPPPADSRARKAVRTTGELLITAGLVILLFVVYEVYVTDLISAGKQDDATHALDEQWNANTVESADPRREAKYDLVEGQAFAKMYIPVFGPDYKFSVVEGTTDKHLEIGPGHYVNTALPGNPGNFAVAGHRVGKGAPFNDLDLMNSCDAIVVETQSHWFVYRMLPKSGEVAGWAQGPKAKDPKCAQVAPLGGAYDKTVGQEIVLPSQGEVINAIPHVTGAATPEAQQAALMTLTTCHPRFSDKQRLIVHAVLTQSYPKAPGFVPAELKEQ